MKFSGAFNVPAPRDIVYERLNDPEFFASCVEGVHDLVEVDPGRYTAMLDTRIVYIKFKFAVTVSFVEQVPPERIVASAEGTPHGVVGRLTASASANLADLGDQTEVSYDIDVALAGKLGSIGQPVLRSKARDMEKSFVKNLNAAFTGEPSPGEGPGEGPSDGPAETEAEQQA